MKIPTLDKAWFWAIVIMVWVGICAGLVQIFLQRPVSGFVCAAFSWLLWKVRRLYGKD